MSVETNAHDNPQKRGVRDKIADVINDNFRSDFTMIELLGSGVGLELYLRRLGNLSKITVVERCLASYRKFMSGNKLFSFGAKYGPNKISVVRGNINKLFSDQDVTYDVANLDFCGIFKKTVVHKTMSNVIPVDTLFKKKRIADKGLLFVTYKIDGWYPAGWDQADVVSSPDLISLDIQIIASLNGYSACTEVHREVYQSQEPGKPGRASTMLSLGFRVNI